jgi:ABC-type phosphate/phosphonate transport system substrate-binding protein
MPTADIEIGDEVRQVEAWRAGQLELAGYGARAAAELAARQEIDLHLALRLVGQGCCPELALEILL